VLKSDGSEDRVHDKRAGGLAVAHKTTQDVPVPLPRLENASRRLGSQEEIAASASDVESRRSNTRGFVAILKKAHSVSQAKRTRSGPESTASSQARLFSCCSALG